MVKDQYHEADVCKKISEIQFSIFSPDDIAKQSHIEIVNKNLYDHSQKVREAVPYGVLDRR